MRWRDDNSTPYIVGDIPHGRGGKCTLPGEHDHVRRWGKLRRCRIRDCLTAFTTQHRCPSCGFETNEINTKRDHED